MLKDREHHIRRSGFNRLAALCCHVLLLACAAGCTSVGRTGASDDKSPIVWPVPPAEPRIALAKTIASPKDCGIRRSVWQLLARIFAGPGRASRGFVKPLSVALDDDGSICIADPGLSSVIYLDRTGRRFRSWRKIGNVRFQEPVAVAKSGNTIFAADSASAHVFAFDLTGKPVWTKSKGVTRPAGLAVLGETLLVADAGAHRVIVVDATGRTIMRFGRRGTGDGEFNFPTHVAVDSALRGSRTTPHIYVTDAMNHRVQVFEPTGRFVRSIGSVGDSSGHLSKPKGVAVDAKGHVYIVDAMFDNVQVFDHTGRFLMHWGETGTGRGEFWLPSGIAIGANNEIIVADSYNGRIQSFMYIGNETKAVDAP